MGFILNKFIQFKKQRIPVHLNECIQIIIFFHLFVKKFDKEKVITVDLIFEYEN